MTVAASKIDGSPASWRMYIAACCAHRPHRRHRRRRWCMSVGRSAPASISFPVWQVSSYVVQAAVRRSCDGNSLKNCMPSRQQRLEFKGCLGRCPTAMQGFMRTLALGRSELPERSCTEVLHTPS